MRSTRASANAEICSAYASNASSGWDPPVGDETDPERPDRACHEDPSSTGHLDAHAIQLLHPIPKPVMVERETIGTEGVRYDDPGPRVDESPMDAFYEVWIIGVEQLEACVERHPALNEGGPHASVGEQGP